MSFRTLFMTMLTLAAGFAWVAAPGEGGSAAAAPPPSPALDGTIVAVGDSLTAGYGVPETEAYPAQLEKKLQRAGYRWRVVNAGVSGETSAGALSRADWILRLKPDIVILETGANDGLRGVDPKVTRGNIDTLVTLLKSKGVVVVLAGMKMFTNLGPTYARDFGEMYPRVASKHDLILIPFFLKGVAGVPSLNQGDSIHPLAKGYRTVTDTVYPFAVQAIERKNRQRGTKGH